jgi:hypothetical protein
MTIRSAALVISPSRAEAVAAAKELAPLLYSKVSRKLHQLIFQKLKSLLFWEAMEPSFVPPKLP